MSLYKELFTEIQTLSIVDTHEHLPLTEQDRDPNADVFMEYLIHYFSRDLLSAGMPKKTFQQITSPGLNPSEKWKLAAPWWEICRHTGYGQSLDLSAQALYGLTRIDGSTIEELDKKFRQSRLDGSYRRVLKEKSKIEFSVVNRYESAAHMDTAYFKSSQCIGQLIRPTGGWTLVLLEQLLGKPINSFRSYLQGVEAFLDKELQVGPFFKCALAYSRSLNFPVTPYHEAEKDFQPLITSWNVEIEKQDQQFMPGENLQNFMMHYILGYLSGRNAIVQIHTGMQEGSGNILANCNPEPLCRLFQLYPNVRFDVFHMGYPYHNLLGAMGKMFPNVYIDMCWAHIISPPACVKMLEEWLETVPYNKIFGFGGDYCFVDGVYGHQYLARTDIAKALTKKVEEGLFSEEKALTVAKALLHDNLLALL